MVVTCVCERAPWGLCVHTFEKKKKNCTRGQWNKRADVWKRLSPNPPSTWAGLYFSHWHTVPIYNVSVLWIGCIPGCPWVDFPKRLSLICSWRRPNSWLWHYKRLYFFFFCSLFFWKSESERAGESSLRDIFPDYCSRGVLLDFLTSESNTVNLGNRKACGTISVRK